MKLGMIGLGRMGANMAQRLTRQLEMTIDDRGGELVALLLPVLPRRNPRPATRRIGGGQDVPAFDQAQSHGRERSIGPGCGSAFMGLPSIGIGAASLPDRPLPHHPACGSAPGG